MDKKTAILGLIGMLVPAVAVLGPALYEKVQEAPEGGLKLYAAGSAIFLILLTITTIAILIRRRRAYELHLAQIAASAQVYLIRPARREKPSPEAAASLLAGLLPALADVHASFEIIATREGIGFYAWAPEQAGEALRIQVQGFYPTAQVEKVDDPLGPFRENGAEVAWLEFGLRNKSAYPIRWRDIKKADPLGALVQALAIRPEMSAAGIQFVARPASNGWQRKGQGEIKQIQRRFMDPATQKRKRDPSASEKRQLSDLEAKLDEQTGFHVALRVFGVDGDRPRIKSLTQVLNQYATAEQSFTKKGEGDDWSFCQRRPIKKKENVLHAGEFAALWHLPGSEISPSILWARARFLPAPLTLRANGSSPHRLFGYSWMPSGERIKAMYEHGFPTKTHSYVLGPTGSGKSVLIENWVLQDIAQGYGVLVMEPHGDLTNALLKKLPPEREADVVILDATDPKRTFALNLMEPVPGVEPQFIASQVMAVFQKIIGANWDGAVRMQRIIRNGTLALLEGEECPTLVHLFYFFSDEGYRDDVLTRVKDPIVKAFWLRNFAGWGDSEQKGAIAPVLTRVERFLTNRVVRRILARPRSTIDFRRMMDEGRIIFVRNLAGSSVGADNAELLGALIVSKTWTAAASRRDIPEQERREFFVYIDEFQNYATPDIATILAEARKFAMGYCMANQYFEQIPTYMQQAIDGNCRTKVTFRLESAGDAVRLARMYGGEVKPADLQALGAYEVYVRTLKGSKPQRVFTAQTLPPPEPAEDYDRPGRIGGVGPQPEPLPIPQLSPAVQGIVKDIKSLSREEKVQSLVGLSEADWDTFQQYRQALDRRQLLNLLKKPNGVPDRERRVQLLSNLRTAAPVFEADVVVERLEAKSGDLLVSDTFEF